VNDPDQGVTWFSGPGDELEERVWTYEDSAEADDNPTVDSATGLVSLRFLGSALRRGARIWCIMAVVGLLVGAGLYLKSAPVYKASASVLVADNPKADPAAEVLTDIALAQSTKVANGVVQQLGLTQTPAQFLGTYTVTMVSDQVLSFTTQAATSAEAVARASAVATQFLKFRAQYTQMQQQQTEVQLNQQVNQAQRVLDSINKQISQVSAQPSSSAQQAQLTSLRAQQTAAENALESVQQFVTSTLASTRMTTQTMVQGSQVLNTAAPLKRSVLKTAGLYGAGGLFGGLVLGMIIAIIGAVTSDRLRRRDNIAEAIGAPVRLSVGPLSRNRWLPDRPGRAQLRQRDMERVVEHLRTAVPGSSRGPAGLAVVAVDDTQTVARAVVELAFSSARQRRRVVVADLSADAQAARLMGADIPGISTVNSEGVPIVVVVPAAQDVAPVGPLRSRTSSEGYAEADESVAAACTSADLVLSLVTLDPAFGGEHLATWATDVVAVVTAGLSTAARIQAVGEMIRLAATRLESVVVLDADKSDESLGAVSTAAYHPTSL
jgi:Chain length determinant protein